MSEVYSFVNCSGYQSSAKINRSILWESIVYIEFIIRGIYILLLFVNCVLHNKIYDKLTYGCEAHIHTHGVLVFCRKPVLNINQHYVILLSLWCLQDNYSIFWFPLLGLHLSSLLRSFMIQLSLLCRLRGVYCFCLFFFFSFLCSFSQF